MREYNMSFRAQGKKVRSVKKGEVILTSEPFVHVINYEYSSMYCDHCLACHRETLLRACRGCRVTWYCSYGCQSLGWALHRWECQYLKRRCHSLPPDFVRLMARIIFKLRDGGDKIVEKYTEREGRRYRDLMNHYADIKRSPERKEDVDYLIKELKNYIGAKYIPNYSDFLGIYGRLLVNRFSLMDKTMLNMGSALYLAASIFDHACTPNCYISFLGRKVQIRSLVDIPVLDYSKCRISYVDPVSSVTSRREELYKKWFFWCDCRTCRDQERAMFENCITCEEWECQAPVYVPETRRLKQAPTQRDATAGEGKQRAGQKEEEEGEQEAAAGEGKQNRGQQDEGASSGRSIVGRQEEEEEEPVCSLCERPVTSSTVRRYQEAVAFTRDKLKAMTEENPSMSYCLEILEKQGNLFSPMNVWRVRTLDFAFNAAMFNGCWSLTLKYGEENMNGMRYYYGAEHPTYALFLFKLGKAKMYFKEFREGLRLLDEAQPLLKIGLGPCHPIINELYLISCMANEDIEICLERRLAASKKRTTEVMNRNEIAECRMEIKNKLSQLLSPGA